MNADGTNNNLQNLRDEIAKLSERLALADREKAQAGELGLHLLREKEQLELTHENLLKELDSVRTELERTQKQLASIRSNQRHAAATELDHELGLLEDSAKMEAQFVDRVTALETEVRQLMEQLNIFKSESERLAFELESFQLRVTELETEKRTMREELKELKQREQFALNENGELEEENVSLQKQVSNLKSTQIEFESMKLQLKNLLEEVVILQTVADEANKLRSLAERQEAEALAAAQQEREQRLALKKEFEQLRNQGHLSTLNSLYLGIKGADRDIVKQLENSFISDNPIETFANGNTKGPKDLFSELNGDLEDRLNGAQAENERLKEAKQTQQKIFVQMLLPFFHRLDLNGNFEECDVSKLKDYMALALERFDERMELKKEAKETEKQEQRMREALREAILLAGRKDAHLTIARGMIVRLGQALHTFFTELNGTEEGQQNQGERRHIANGLADRLNAVAQRIQPFENGMKRLGSPPPNGGGESPPPTDVSSSVSVETAESDSPRVLLPSPELCRPMLSQNFLKELEGIKIGADAQKENFALNELVSEGDLRECLLLAGGDGTDTDDSQMAYGLAGELLKAVRNEAEQRISARMALEDKDKADLYQNITKLKSQLAIKREQVSSLRSVLRSNKSSTESVLQCLREKFESEFRLKDEANEVLRNQLKQFKEDAATFASHRATFTARSEELQQQVESLQDSLKMAEEEKKTINQLLRMSIQQKLALTQRLEELEMDRERQMQQLREKDAGGHANVHQPQQSQQPKRTGPGGGQRSGGGAAYHQPTTRAVRYPGSSSLPNHHNGGPRGKQ
ncbi:hypothetical protein niasHS_003502 [Heterodera schachtii]|uniref:Uncharacterized protein n=1 Tax=Heterodera schachtii TaxID=97005 RepID=A0ABD2KGP2_HETSC